MPRYISTSAISIPLPGLAPNATNFETGDFSYSEPFSFAPVIAERFRDRIKAMWPAYEAKARELGVEPSWHRFQFTAEGVLKVAEAAKLQVLDRDFAERIALNSRDQHDATADTRERLATALTKIVDGFSAPAHDPDLVRMARAFGCKPEDLERAP